MNTRVNVILPNSTIKVLDRVADKGQRSNFIDIAIRYYIESQSKKNLRKLLKKEALVNTNRDLKMAEEWFPLEEEI